MRRKPQRAVILAAGRGRRLHPYTLSQPKPLVEIGGRPIIDLALKRLECAGITEVVIVAGYHAEQLRRAVREWEAGLRIHFVTTEDFDRTNNIFSLWLARDWLCDDLLLLEADLVFQPELITGLLAYPEGSNVAVVSKLEPHMSGACVEVEADGLTISRLFYPQGDSPGAFKTANIYRLGGDFCRTRLVPALNDHILNGQTNCYYEEVFKDLIETGSARFDALIGSGSSWFEIDNDDDLQRAAFGTSELLVKLQTIEEEYGGYWRYHVVDHRLLYNLHYPPSGLEQMLTARLRPLIRNYPAGQSTIGKFVARYLDIDPDVIAVGNGASEFIRILARLQPGPLMVPVPAFEEFANAARDGVIPFALCEADQFELDPDRFVGAATASGARTAVLINPNNPTGNFIPPEVVTSLVKRLAASGITTVLDESFIDFHPRPDDASLLRSIHKLPSLVIVKSLSKSHGLSGLRLGFLASGDKELVRSVHRELPIWNVNGIAEEYLRLASAYLKEFRASCTKVRYETDALKSWLAALPGVTVYPSSTNFVFGKLDPRYGSAVEMEVSLLATDSILIKTCKGKSMPDADQFFRIASRSGDENAALVHAIGSYIHGQEELIGIPRPAARMG